MLLLKYLKFFYFFIKCHKFIIYDSDIVNDIYVHITRKNHIPSQVHYTVDALVPHQIF